MSLSAIDCIVRGIANLRANWELVLLQLVQTVVCLVLTIVSVVGLIMVLGASFLLELSDPSDWASAVERLEGFSVDGGLLAMGLAVLVILLTVVGLVYCWFQAGIMATLERGERQAPLLQPVVPQLFRTFSGRNFRGWGNAGAWRYFNYFSLITLFGTVILGLLVVAALIFVAAMGESAGATAALVGCLGLIPILILVVLLNLWFMMGMALLPREEFGAWRAVRTALTIFGRRFGGALLIALLFIIASASVGLVFWPLGQGMASALEGSIPAWFAVQLLLTIAQWLVNGILTVAFFASVTALVRTELDHKVV